MCNDNCAVCDNCDNLEVVKGEENLALEYRSNTIQRLVYEAMMLHSCVTNKSYEWEERTNVTKWMNIENLTEEVVNFVNMLPALIEKVRDYRFSQKEIAGIIHDLDLVYVKLFGVPFCRTSSILITDMNFEKLTVGLEIVHGCNFITNYEYFKPEYCNGSDDDEEFFDYIKKFAEELRRDEEEHEEDDDCETNPHCEDCNVCGECTTQTSCVDCDVCVKCEYNCETDTDCDEEAEDTEEDDEQLESIEDAICEAFGNLKGVFVNIGGMDFAKFEVGGKQLAIPRFVLDQHNICVCGHKTNTTLRGSNTPKKEEEEPNTTTNMFDIEFLLSGVDTNDRIVVLYDDKDASDKFINRLIAEITKRDKDVQVGVEYDMTKTKLAVSNLAYLNDMINQGNFKFIAGIPSDKINLDYEKGEIEQYLRRGKLDEGSQVVVVHLNSKGLVEEISTLIY